MFYDPIKQTLSRQQGATMAYNRILLPVDGSEHSMHAVAHAVTLARCGGEIVVATYGSTQLPC